MDGLIPMAFRAVKKNLTRRRYECLSSSSTTRDSYNFVSDTERNVEGHHRRRWSMGDFSSLSSRETKRSSGGAREKGCSPPREGQLVRYKSHRLFSCISGQQYNLSFQENSKLELFFQRVGWFMLQRCVILNHVHIRYLVMIF